MNNRESVINFLTGRFKGGYIDCATCKYRSGLSREEPCYSCDCCSKWELSKTEAEDITNTIECIIE